jgi:hypothetical protein
MEDRVRQLLERVRETAASMGEAAGTTARYAGKCAGQMVDVAKLNMKIFDLKNDMNQLLGEVGQLVYDTHRGQAPDVTPLDELLAQLDAKNAAIGELKERIAVLKNSRQCTSCGATCGREDKYCRDCGAPL